MRLHPVPLCTIVVLAVIAQPVQQHTCASDEPARSTRVVRSRAPSPGADALLRGHGGVFVPNVGQWEHGARFVHRSGPMTLFLRERGWVVDLAEIPRDVEKPDPLGRSPLPAPSGIARKIRAVALEMTFEGSPGEPEVVGESRLTGHHDYFIGADPRCWRTEVPLFAAVRYAGLYPGIDLRLREDRGVPEYDLLLRPGADLSKVSVRVDGGRGLTIASDGSLVIETALGPLVQSLPKAWQVGAGGARRAVTCRFVRLGADRFGFVAVDWDGRADLTIDPPLVWSTYFGGRAIDHVVSLDIQPNGLVTIGGSTYSPDCPTVRGAYDISLNGVNDGFVTRLDPRLPGSAQLVFSTYIGGAVSDGVGDLDVDENGVVTVTGVTTSSDYPTTTNAFDSTANGPAGDLVVSRLDPRRAGAAQLVYSTYLGGASREYAPRLHVDASGTITVSTYTDSSDFPTTITAFDRTYNGFNSLVVCRLLPILIGSAQLVYSTYLQRGDGAPAVSVDSRGILTVAGNWYSRAAPHPTTVGAFDSTPRGDLDGFVCRIDPSRQGSAQMVYCTLLGGAFSEGIASLAVDAAGLLTVAGWTESTDFPVTPRALQTAHNGGRIDCFVTQLDPSRFGPSQLVYSTFLGGKGGEAAARVSVADSRLVTVVGLTEARGFPTTPGAYSVTFGGGVLDGFLTRLDPTRSGPAQLVYSTLLGGTGLDYVVDAHVDPAGVVTVVGDTSSTDYPTTPGAYDTTLNLLDGFVSRIDMGVEFHADAYEVSIGLGGVQTLTMNAGRRNANRLYWIFGSMSGTAPGVNLLGLDIPLNPDAYTSAAMTAVNTAAFTRFRGTLAADGSATATFNLPPNLPVPPGLTLNHAFVVYDATGRLFLASNPVPVRLR